MKKKISLNPPKLFLQTNPVDDSDHIASYIGRKLNDCPIYVLVYQWAWQIWKTFNIAALIIDVL